MRKVFAFLVGATVFGGLPVSAQEQDDILELTEQGFLHCTHPNSRAKTCRSIDSYERIQDGVYNSTTLMAAGSGVTLEIYTPVWLENGEFCGSVREQDLMTSIVRVNGREVAPRVAAPALQRVLNENRARIDLPFCVRFEPSGANYVGRVTVDGEHRPEFDTPIKLITADDGYRVAR